MTQSDMHYDHAGNEPVGAPPPSPWQIAFQEITQRLDHSDMEPRVGNELLDKGALNDLWSRFETEILDGLTEHLFDLPEGAPRDRAHESITLVGLELAVLTQLAGDSIASSRRLELVGSNAADNEVVKDELKAAEYDAAGYIILMRARWCQRMNDSVGADAAAKELKRTASSEWLADQAQKLIDRPRPLDSAPTLYTFNGIGTGVYGHRDEWSDGSYITTLCFCVLFVPLFPISAYRVIREGQGWIFFTKERLSGFARGYRWALAAAIIGLVAFSSIDGYLNSPKRLASIAFDEAHARETSGHTEEALQAYDRILSTYATEASQQTVGDTARGVMRLTTASIEEPMSAERVDQVSQVVRRFEELPERAKNEVRDGLRSQLEGWTEQIGTDNASNARASLRVLDMAHRIAPSDELEARQRSLHVALADLLVVQWLQEALEHYARGEDEAKTKALVERIFLSSPSLMIAGQEPINWWMERAGSEAEGARSAMAQALESAARVSRLDALESRDRAALEQALEEVPGDHDLIAALSDHLRSEGDPAAAIERLAALGTPGELNAAAQQSLAMSFADSGEIERAESILGHLVAFRMPAFQEAARAYGQAAEALADRLTTRAQAGMLDPSLERELRFATEEDAQRIFGEYLSEQISNDPELIALRQRSTSLSSIVPAALSLGTLKLRRASGASGEEKEALLAEAERLFLSIREQAEGVPAFHLGLGQVYHRLGKAEEGERELGSLLAGNDELIKLEVSEVYRELGNHGRAREVAEAVFQSSDNAEVRTSAALRRSMMSIDLEESEQWLRRASESGGNNAMVEVQLKEVRAERALQAGNWDEAAGLFREVAQEHGRDARHDSAAANNQAISYQSLYQCTGNIRDLDQAVRGLEAALRLTPDNALIIGNLAGILEYRGRVKTLERWVRPAVLRLSNSEATTLISHLSRGSEREALLPLVQSNLARALELGRQERVLAPHRMAPVLRELDLLSLTEDAEALGEIASSLEQGAEIDTSSMVEARQRWSSESEQQKMQQHATDALRKAERIVEEARSARHAPTLAAALVLLADAEKAMARYEGVSSARASLESLREAHRVWPAMSVETNIADRLLEIALLEAGQAHAPLQTRIEADWRLQGTTAVVYSALQSEERAGAVAALRARSELAEAAELRRRLGENKPSVQGWLLGQILEDSELESANEAARRALVDVNQHRIGRYLDPGQPNREVFDAIYQIDA